jgi:DME family drug/metabolite transporter
MKIRDKDRDSMKINKVAPLAITVAGCLWGTMGLFVRYLNGHGLNSMEICEIRSIITAVVLVAGLAVFNRKLLIIRFRDIWIFACGGVLSIVFFNVCYFKAIEIMSLSVAAILLYTAPIFVMLLSAAFFREKITKRKVISIVLAFGGCVLVSGILTGSVEISTFGILCGLGAGIGYALYSIFSRVGLNRGYHSLTVTAYTFVFAAVGGAFLTDFETVYRVAGESAGVSLYFILFSVVTTILPYILYTAGLGYVENSKASVIASIEPVVATLLGVFVFREKLTFVSAVGVLMVLAAVTLLSYKAKKTEIRLHAD